VTPSLHDETTRRHEMRMRRRWIVGTALVAGAGALSAGIAIAASGGDGDRPLTGAVLEKAASAALAHTGGGTVIEAEAGDDGAAYGVEVRLADGTEVEVGLAEDFAVVGQEADGDRGEGEDGGAEGQALPRGSEAVTLDPADFVERIDNLYWPMSPGTTWTYHETGDGGARLAVEVTVTDETRTILGIAATVVHDVVTEDGEVVEDTYDWYAQDRWGNIWYLGEATKEYENGKVASTAGSWEAGVDGALPGIVMPGAPEVGLSYRQEHYAGEAEDQGEIVSLSERVQVPYGAFGDVVMTRDTTPLEPDLVEHKYYARGVGPVLAVAVSSGGGREELVGLVPGS
jgi:hypothetical protein